MRWYRGWASLYLLKVSQEGPTTFGARSVSDRQWRRFFRRVEFYLQPAFGTTVPYVPPEDVSMLEGLCSDVRKNVYISDADVYANASCTEEEQTQHDDVHNTYDSGDPSTFQGGLEVEGFSAQYIGYQWMEVGSTSQPPAESVEEPDIHALRRRPIRAPETYTPGSDALPPRLRRPRK